MANDIIILGVFVADAAFRATRMPKVGETLIGTGFTLGPGGKGSNQAVAAAKVGGDVGFITRLGTDSFGDMADAVWAEAGVTSLATKDAASATGAAGIFIDASSGENAIVIAPGAAAQISAEDVARHADVIAAAKVAVAQLEQPVEAAEAFLKAARDGGAMTILNPAPAQPLSTALLSLCDYVTPNETEAEALTGLSVTDAASAEQAARSLMDMGVRHGVIITLGADGAYHWTGSSGQMIDPMKAGEVVDTTGAGDAFNGGLAAALAEGQSIDDALRFATATAALSVTKIGTAASMPNRAEVDALLGGNL